jgi:hypothetical protein
VSKQEDKAQPIESNNTNCFHFAGISLLMKYAQMITAEMWLKIITTNTIIIIAVITKRGSKHYHSRQWANLPTLSSKACMQLGKA